MQKKDRGGARAGAGRKPLNKPTRTISFRIAEEHALALVAVGSNPADFYRQAGERALKRMLKAAKA